MTTLGAALRNAFDVLNVNKMQTGLDMYGQGRYPFYLEPTMIITITDGGKISHPKTGVHEEVSHVYYTNLSDASRITQFVFFE